MVVRFSKVWLTKLNNLVPLMTSFSSKNKESNYSVKRKFNNETELEEFFWVRLVSHLTLQKIDFGSSPSIIFKSSCINIISKIDFLWKMRRPPFVVSGDKSGIDWIDCCLIKGIISSKALEVSNGKNRK